MSFFPIIERELRQLSRRPMTYRLRSATALVATLTSLGALGLALGKGTSPYEMGRLIFSILTVLAFGLTLLAGPVLAADCLSGEKRAGTLGLLFLTNLRGYHLVAGKLAALALPPAHCLLAVFPVLAISFFMGGVTAGEFARVALVLANTLFFSLSAALFLSALCRDGRKSLIGAFLLIFAITLGLPALEFNWSAGRFAAHPLLTLPSPAWALFLTPRQNFSAAYFWSSLATAQFLGWLCLILAGAILPRTWQDRPEKLSPARWLGIRSREKPVKKLSPTRAPLLETDPILWLAQRNRPSVLRTWIFLLVFIVLCLAAYRAVNRRWFEAGIVFIAIYFLHAVVKFWMVWEASRQFTDDRDNGALELLLCAPLREESIWRGWLIHLKRRFVTPTLALLLLDALLMIGGFDAYGWWGGSGAWAIAFLAGMGLFVADMYALSWVGLWQGLAARTSMRACLNTSLYILVLPAAACLGVMALCGLFLPVSLIPFNGLITLWFAVGYLSDCAVCARMMVKFRDEFRAVSIYGAAAGEHRLSWDSVRQSIHADGFRSEPPISNPAAV
jgi:ABC-type transport system involved in multi-copper enzyme maturation permease subunit